MGPTRKHQTPKDTHDRSGYREEQPRDRGQARQPAEPARPSPDEPGIERDTDDHPVPDRHERDKRE
jgi:hypothetical protein